MTRKRGLKRIPIQSGKIVYDKKLGSDWTKTRLGQSYGYDIDYLDNHGTLSINGMINEAHELALRIISARQAQLDKDGAPRTNDLDPLVSKASGKDRAHSYKRRPFMSWDDFYFRVVQPWDEHRYNFDPFRGYSAPMLMAHFNSNTDLLKFNPNIEWIDRWGRNFHRDGTGDDAL